MVRLFKLIGIYLLASGFAALALLFSTFPNYPKTVTAWGILSLVALPITLVGEAIGSAIFENRFAQTIEERTKEQSLSGLRILYGLVTMLLAFAIIGAISVFLQDRGFDW